MQDQELARLRGWHIDDLLCWHVKSALDTVATPVRRLRHQPFASFETGTMDFDSQWQQWLGKTQTATDTLALPAQRRLAATLDHGALPLADGDQALPLSHWLCFLPETRHSELSADGHPPRGGFLPPINLPRRMWAASKLQFHEPLSIGTTLHRESHISAIKPKTGRSGVLAFVEIEHSCRNESQLLITESQTLVFREAAKTEPKSNDAHSVPSTSADQSSPVPDFQHELVIDAARLFRYSALTFNAHRIHIDRDYAREVEGYAGLVVHGPLLATLLADLLRQHQPDQQLKEFSFQALAPAIAERPLTLNLQLERDAPLDKGLQGWSLWVNNEHGQRCMSATATTQ